MWDCKNWHMCHITVVITNLTTFTGVESGTSQFYGVCQYIGYSIPQLVMYSDINN